MSETQNEILEQDQNEDQSGQELRKRRLQQGAHVLHIIPLHHSRTSNVPEHWTTLLGLLLERPGDMTIRGDDVERFREWVEASGRLHIHKADGIQILGVYLKLFRYYLFNH